MDRSGFDEQINGYLSGLTRENYSKPAADCMLDIIPKGFLKPAHFSLIQKQDSHKFTESSVTITASTDSYESFVFSLLQRELSVNPEVVDALVSYSNTHREGSLSRHFFMAAFFSSVGFRDFPSKFCSASWSLQQTIEFIFSEMYQVDGSASVYSPEELKVISSQGMAALKRLVLGFIKSNSPALKLEAEVIEVSDYFALDDSFESRPALPIPADTLNKASFVRFLGSLIAKVDFASFYAQKLGQDRTLAILKDLQSLLKPFHDLVFRDALGLLESDAKLLGYRKYSELCQQPGDTKSMVNLHATIAAGERRLPGWDGYGSLLCIYVLRNLLPQQDFVALSPLKLLKLVCAGTTGIPQDYQGGIEYFLPLLQFLLRKLQASQLALENRNERNCFLGDFLVTLHAIDFPNCREAHAVVRELADRLLAMGSLQNRYLFLVRFLDLAEDPKHFCSSKAFTAALSSLYAREVREALARDVRVPELFLRDSPLFRLLDLLFRADPRQTGNVAASSRR